LASEYAEPEYVWTSAEETCAARYVFPCVSSLLAAIDHGARVLDAGCGNGSLTGQLAALGYQLVGIDASRSGIEIAVRTFPGIRFEAFPVEGDLLARLNEPPFDAVVSTEVIEHVYAPIAFAKSCFDALRPGGIFVCSAPYHGYLKNISLAIANRFDSHWQPLQEGGHIKFFSRGTLSELLLRVGFELPQFRGAGRLPYLWKSMVIAARKPAPIGACPSL
jgi:2-polyprenyl-3-methyl-5-hydroxy-6-metoxy-1,4-benzoquinol methylase